MKSAYLKTVIISLFVGLMAAISTSFAAPAPKGHAEIKVDGKPVDLKRLTDQEVITLATLVMKAAGK